jgi:hypothetical protein
MSVNLSKAGTCRVMERCEVHGDEDRHEMMVIKLQLGKQEREKQKQVLIKAKVSNRFFILVIKTL